MRYLCDGGSETRSLQGIRATGMGFSMSRKSKLRMGLVAGETLAGVAEMAEEPRALGISPDSFWRIV